MNLSRVTLATASSVLLLATLAACGGDDTASDDTAAASSGQQAGGQMPGGPGGMAPGASGEVAAVSGKTAQVQSQTSGQVAVSWTDDTTFTAQVDGTLADVSVGACVVVTPADDSTEDTSEVAADAVRVMAAGDDGSCGFGGAGGPGGERPEGAPSEMPTDRPSDGAGRPGGFGTVGEVTAVSGSGFTVSATDTEVSVTVSDDTTYTTSAKASASDVKVGACVSAQGDTDDTGAVTATSMSVSQPVDGACTGGFGMGGGRPEDVS